MLNLISEYNKDHYEGEDTDNDKGLPVSLSADGRIKALAEVQMNDNES
jgi:hypothetical protein